MSRRERLLMIAARGQHVKLSHQPLRHCQEERRPGDGWGRQGSLSLLLPYVGSSYYSEKLDIFPYGHQDLFVRDSWLKPETTMLFIHDSYIIINLSQPTSDILRLMWEWEQLFKQIHSKLSLYLAPYFDLILIRSRSGQPVLDKNTLATPIPDSKHMKIHCISSVMTPAVKAVSFSHKMRESHDVMHGQSHKISAILVQTED